MHRRCRSGCSGLADRRRPSDDESDHDSQADARYPRGSAVRRRRWRRRRSLHPPRWWRRLSRPTSGSRPRTTSRSWRFRHAGCTRTPAASTRSSTSRRSGSSTRRTTWTRFAIHVGDPWVVANVNQWSRASRSMATHRRSGRPQLRPPGQSRSQHHDGGVDTYDTYFPPSRYAAATSNSTSARYGGYRGDNQSARMASIARTRTITRCSTQAASNCSSSTSSSSRPRTRWRGRSA